MPELWQFVESNAIAWHSCARIAIGLVTECLSQPRSSLQKVSKIVRGMLPIEPRPLSQLLRTYDRETNASEPLRASPTLKLVPQSHTSRTVLFRAPADT